MVFGMRNALNHQTKHSLLASPILAGLFTILFVLLLSAATLGALWAYVYLFQTDQSIVQLSSRIAKAGTMATWAAIAIGLSLPLGLFGLRSILDRPKQQSGVAVVIVTLVCAILAALAEWFNIIPLWRVVSMSEIISVVLAMLVAIVSVGVAIIRRYWRSGTPAPGGTSGRS